MKRYYVIFTGQVQGVGFRWTAINIARAYGLTGYVKNLDNGNVAVEVQGKDESIDAFLKEIMMPHHYIEIDDYAIKETPLKDERDFDVIY